MALIKSVSRFIASVPIYMWLLFIILCASFVLNPLLGRDPIAPIPVRYTHRRPWLIPSAPTAAAEMCSPCYRRRQVDMASR